jgi:hypothetical protein
MPDYRATNTNEISLRVGEEITLESLRQAVVPPYLMLIPFLELPAFVESIRQDSLEEDGIHGCIYTLRAIAPGNGQLRIGFRDLQSNSITHQKYLQVKVSG